MSSMGESSPKPKSPHCSNCGHPGSKRAHLKLACEYCSASSNENCMQKPVGFKCECSTCDMVHPSLILLLLPYMLDLDLRTYGSSPHLTTLLGPVYISVQTYL